MLGPSSARASAIARTLTPPEWWTSAVRLRQSENGIFLSSLCRLAFKKKQNGTKRNGTIAGDYLLACVCYVRKHSNAQVEVVREAGAE